MIEVMNSFENSAKLFLELMEALAEGNSLNREERKNLKIELENLRELVRSKRREHLIFEDNIMVLIVNNFLFHISYFEIFIFRIKNFL